LNENEFIEVTPINTDFKKIVAKDVPTLKTPKEKQTLSEQNAVIMVQRLEHSIKENQDNIINAQKITDIPKYLENILENENQIKQVILANPDFKWNRDNNKNIVDWNLNWNYEQNDVDLLYFKGSMNLVKNYILNYFKKNWQKIYELGFWAKDNSYRILSSEKNISFGQYSNPYFDKKKWDIYRKQESRNIYFDGNYETYSWDKKDISIDFYSYEWGKKDYINKINQIFTKIDGLVSSPIDKSSTMYENAKKEQNLHYENRQKLIDKEEKEAIQKERQKLKNDKL